MKRFIAILIPATVVSYVLSGLIAILGILIAWYQDVALAIISRFEQNFFDGEIDL
jgi:hypothetical protein